MAEKRRYALCVHAEENEDLQVCKVYAVLPDDSSRRRGHLRVVDDSGEDYLYPADSFVLLELPEAATRALRDRSKLSSAKRANPAPQPPGKARR